MKTTRQHVALRQHALFIPDDWLIQTAERKSLSETTGVLLANCAKLGYTFSEDLLKHIEQVSPQKKMRILELLKAHTGVKKNWTPLVKQWDIPTGESVLDHVFTMFANLFKTKDSIQLDCGHLIPENTFPLERYNGCPFCGTPFEFAELEYVPSKSKLTVLELWKEKDLIQYMLSLVASPVALDATQRHNLEVLMVYYDLPKNIEIGIKETLMLLIDILVKQHRVEEAGKLFQTPNDILRYLWYKQTGFLQIIQPKVITKRMGQNAKNWNQFMSAEGSTRLKAAKDLKLKFNRAECRQYATWLNGLKMNIAKQCESMHPKRSMWVRAIRALRLAEYSKRKGFEQLARLLDAFYNQDYQVWQGEFDQYKLKLDADNAFKLLKQRPGLFARSLFASMLWFGREETIGHFREIIAEIPTRLIFTLNMYAEYYFDPQAQRTVKPLGGLNKRIPANQLLQLYNEKELKAMQETVKDLSLEAMKTKFARSRNENKTIYIDGALDQIPVAIGDRSQQIQDFTSTPMGTRFPVEGDTVRLFMQWGNGLHAQHMDMDLSCRVAYENWEEFCSYSSLKITGCKHSGDIQRIPNKVGTAEYIDVDVLNLGRLGARYVIFTCNAYSNGSLAPNMVVGWMNSNDPMKISKQGVAYNPTQVQHQVSITQGLAKGMVFGVLDVQAREMIWLELEFGGQIIQGLNTQGVEAMLRKLDAKLKIGTLLKLKADVQGLEVLNDPEEADEVYDLKWVMNGAEVNQLLMG